jgi:hypothetical protein
LIVSSLTSSEKRHKYAAENYKRIKSVNNRKTVKTVMMQAFPKKWWVESDFKAPNLPLSLRETSQVCCRKFKLERIICALRHFQQFFCYIAAVGFIGGGQQSTQ